MNTLRLILKILLPLVVLAFGAVVAWLIVTNTKKPIVREPGAAAPLVRAFRTQLSNEPLQVRTQGTVEPLRVVELAAEVGGRIISTHDSLRAGGTFTPNDVLVQIDKTDLEFAIKQQQSAVARAELRLAQEKAEAEVAVRAWQKLEGDKPADALVRREPQIKDAKLALDAANAQLKRAQLDLARTSVTLPFSGRVRSVQADIGQTVQRGQRLAVVLDTTELEVRLPISVTDAAFVDLPLVESTDKGPRVTLSADFAGKRQSWSGKIVRTEGEIDRRTRQLTVVARVTGTADASPLLVGMFVQAVIDGRKANDVVVVPRATLGVGDHVWVIAPRLERYEGLMPVFSARLQRRKVDVLRKDRGRILLRSGVQPGELICESTLDAPVDGMTVRIATINTPTEEDR